MIPLDSYLLFVVASVLLVLTPGPNLLYLISRTLCQGRKAGIVSLAGTTSGSLVHMMAAALGLSAIFVAIPVLYDAVRWAGAAYLLWLAIDALRTRNEGGLFAPRQLAPESPRTLYLTGLLTGILNPKVALFYLALFPQFVNPARGSVLGQSLLLGFTNIAIAIVGDLVFVLLAARAARWLSARPVWTAVQRYVLSAVFAGIAIRLALEERK